MTNLATPIDIFSNELCQSQPLATRIFSASLARDRLQQAYLLTGRSLDDKWNIVITLACYLNCSKLNENKLRRPCFSQSSTGQTWCLNCRWITDKEHPQALKVLTTDSSKSGKISVEKARELSEELAKSSRYFRVVVIENADQEVFHRPAANALLKTIEEPKSTCLIFLFSPSADSVLPTIVSRCQVIQLNASNLNEPALFFSEPVAIKGKNWDEQHSLHVQQACTRLRTSKSGFPYLESIAFAEKLEELIEDDLSFDNIIDLALCIEGKSLKNSQFDKLKIVQYAKRLFDLCELTKLHVLYYVSKRSAIESFAFALKQLQVEFNID